MIGSLKKLVIILASLKLTVSVLSALIIVCIPATLIPQNMPGDFYLNRFPGRLGSMIPVLHMDRFFSSPLFLFLTGLFWLNLLFCTLRRFRGQIRKKDRRSFGPDILHAGLLLLIAGSLYSHQTRQEGYLYMAKGDSMELPGGRFMNMEEFIFEQYADGRPKKWVSRVNISDSPDRKGESREILVNRPLRIDGLVLYQSGYRPSPRPGVYETGLLVTSSPGRGIILFSFLMISGGLFLTFVQKGRKDQ